MRRPRGADRRNRGRHSYLVKRRTALQFVCLDNVVCRPLATDQQARDRDGPAERNTKERGETGVRLAAMRGWAPGRQARGCRLGTTGAAASWRERSNPHQPLHQAAASFFVQKGGSGGSSSSSTFKKPSAPAKAYLRPTTYLLLAALLL